MDAILRQLGELLLGAVPTVVLLVLLFIAYRVIVHGRLEEVLKERHARTQGAVEKAKADIGAADARTAEYEQRIRDAKMALYKAQEARRRQLMEARSAAVTEARAAADAQVKAARQQLEREVAAAKAALESQSDTLASEVIRTVLKPATVPAAGGQ